MKKRFAVAVLSQTLAVTAMIFAPYLVACLCGKQAALKSYMPFWGAVCGACASKLSWPQRLRKWVADVT